MNEIINKIKKVTNEELDSLDTSYINKYNFYHLNSYFHGKSGREHYRLLMYISKIFEKDILYDIGTYRCMSACALSFSGKNKIISYDVEKHLLVNPVIPNINYRIGDVRKDSEFQNSRFAFFDVDHDGKFEELFFNYLNEIKWKGILMCDDIHLNDPMKKWWNSINKNKYDLTSVGHWSGTGLIIFE